MVSILFVNIFKLLAVAIGTGATTVLVAQSLAAAKDNKISKDEQNLLGIVMLIIRMSILMLFLAQAWLTAVVYTGLNINLAILTSVNTLTWMLLGVLFITFVFIDYGIIDRQLGISVQLSTWFTLVFAWAWPILMPLSLDAFLLSYILFTFLAVFFIKKSHQLEVHSFYTEKQRLNFTDTV